MPVGEQLLQLSRGKLSDLPLVEIMGLAYARRLTGRLRLVRENAEKTVRFLNGLPVGASCDPPGAGLLEILAEVQRLSADDLMQLRSLQKEKGADDEGLIRMFGLATDTEIYELQVEQSTRIVLEGCGWRQGRYAFRTGEEQILDDPIFDLNPLTLIYHGIRAHHLHDLPELIQKLQGMHARLNHGWESTLSLPGEYYRHSDLLDHFENGANIGEAIPSIYAELGDLNDALLFLYLLLVTGILEITAASPRPPARAKDQLRIEERVRSGDAVKAPEVSASTPVAAPPADPVPAPPPPEPTAPGAEPAAACSSTSYIITGKRRKGKKRVEEKPETTAPAAATTVPAPVEPELPPVVPPPAPAVPAPASAAPLPPEVSDDDWLFGEPAGAQEEEKVSGLNLPSYYSPPEMPAHLEPGGPDLLGGAGARDAGWGADAADLYGGVNEEDAAYVPGADPEGPESLPDGEFPYFEEEREPPRPELKGVERKKLASALRRTRAAYDELGPRLTGEFDHYERLGVEMDADVGEIEAAYESILDRLDLDHLPVEAQEEFGERRDELCGRARESYLVLRDPNERIALEQAIYNKRKARARTLDQKERLAAQQWRRGKWYLENSTRADLARRCFQEALELDPKPQYFAYVGWALYRNNRSPYELLEARSYLNQALAKNPRYGEAHYFLGLIAKREGELEAARGHFAEAARLNPEDRLAARELNLFQRSARPQGIMGRMFRRT